MLIAQVFYDVKQRLLSDTGALGLFPRGGVARLTGIFNHFSLRGQLMPYLVIRGMGNPHRDAFALDFVDVRVKIELHCSKTPPQLENAQRVLSRLTGDAIAQTSRTPTYGLHRWLPTTSGWAARDPEELWTYDVFRRQSPAQEHRDDRYVFVENYRVNMFKAAAAAPPPGTGGQWDFSTADNSGLALAGTGGLD
jgi:hypothetical protein